MGSEAFPSIDAIVSKAFKFPASKPLVYPGNPKKRENFVPAEVALDMLSDKVPIELTPPASFDIDPSKPSVHEKPDKVPSKVERLLKNSIASKVRLGRAAASGIIGSGALVSDAVAFFAPDPGADPSSAYNPAKLARHVSSWLKTKSSEVGDIPDKSNVEKATTYLTSFLAPLALPFSAIPGILAKIGVTSVLFAASGAENARDVAIKAGKRPDQARDAALTYFATNLPAQAALLTIPGGASTPARAVAKGIPAAFGLGATSSVSEDLASDSPVNLPKAGILGLETAPLAGLAAFHPTLPKEPQGLRASVLPNGRVDVKGTPSPEPVKSVVGKPKKPKDFVTELNATPDELIDLSNRAMNAGDIQTAAEFIKEADVQKKNAEIVKNGTSVAQPNAESVPAKTEDKTKFELLADKVLPPGTLPTGGKAVNLADVAEASRKSTPVSPPETAFTPVAKPLVEPVSQGVELVVPASSDSFATNYLKSVPKSPTKSTEDLAHQGIDKYDRRKPELDADPVDTRPAVDIVTYSDGSPLTAADFNDIKATFMSKMNKYGSRFYPDKDNPNKPFTFEDAWEFVSKQKPLLARQYAYTKRLVRNANSESQKPVPVEPQLSSPEKTTVDAEKPIEDVSTPEPSPKLPGETPPLSEAVSVERPVPRVLPPIDNLSRKVQALLHRARRAVTVTSDALFAREQTPLPFDKLVYKKHGEKQIITKETDDFVAGARSNLIKENGGKYDPVSERAIANYLDTGGDREFLKEIENQTKDPKLKEEYRRAQNLTPVEQDIASSIKMLMDDVGESALKHSIVDGLKENYSTHVRDKGIWKILSGKFNTHDIKENPYFANKRIHEYYVGGEAKGIRYKKDFGTTVTAYIDAYQKAMMTKEIQQSLKDGIASDGRPQSMVYDPKGPDIPVDYQIVDHPAFLNRKVAYNNPSGEIVVHSTPMYVHPEVALKIRNMVMPSKVRANVVGRGLLRLNSEFKTAATILSLFHPVALDIHAVMHKQSPLMTNRAINYLLKKVGVNYELKADFPWDFERRPDANGNETNDQVRILETGLPIFDHPNREIMTDGVGSAKNSWVNQIPFFGRKNAQLSAFIFDDLLPKAKMQLALHTLAETRKTYAGKLTEDQMLLKAVKTANNSFGGQNNLLKNKTFLDVQAVALFAPDFMKSRAKYVGQALTPGGREQQKALLRGAFYMWSATTLANLLISGDPQWEHPFKIKMGDKFYGFSLIPHDIVRLFEDPERFGIHRAGILPTAVAEVATGKDVFGRPKSLTSIVLDRLPIAVQQVRRRRVGENIARTIVETAFTNIGGKVSKVKKSRPAFDEPERRMYR